MPEPDRTADPAEHGRAEDLALLTDAARIAGAIALRHFRRGVKSWDKPDGHGPVTEADLEIDRALRSGLMAARPDYGWLSEESADDPARLAARRVFILDPIDGTRAFIARDKAWAHSLAVVEDGRPIAGVVYLPMLDRVYSAALGGGAAMNGAAIAASGRFEPDGATVLATAPAMNPSWWPGGVPALERHFRTSLAYRLCLVAEGRFDAMLTFRDTWEWDVAAGDLIAREAGAAVTTRSGEATRYNADPPRLSGLVAGAPALQAALVGRIRAGAAPA